MNQETHIDGDALAKAKHAQENNSAIDRLIEKSELAKAKLFIALPEEALAAIATGVAGESGAFTPTQLTVLKGVMAEAINRYKTQKIAAETIINDDYIKNEMFKKSA